MRAVNERDSAAKRRHTVALLHDTGSLNLHVLGLQRFGGCVDRALLHMYSRKTTVQYQEEHGGGYYMKM